MWRKTLELAIFKAMRSSSELDFFLDVCGLQPCVMGLLASISCKKYIQTYIKQGTKGFYAKKTPKGENCINQTIPMCVSIV